MSRSKIVIGITGNIACGKSLVLDTLRELGAETIDADRVAHEAMQPHSECWRRIVAHFGSDIAGPDGQIDRRQLGQIVFADPAELAALERIVHPWVVATIRKRVRQARTRVVAIDAIKLYESGLAEDCDEVWAVTCAPEQQIERLMRRNGFSAAEARTRIDAQPPQAEKAARARRVIDNSGTIAATVAAVRAAFADATNEANPKREH